MVLALGSVVGEAGPLVKAARGVVEKLGRDFLALGVLWIALHDATAPLRDQLEGAAKRHTCDASPSIVPVDENARDAIVGRLIGAGRLVFLPVMDVRKLIRRAVLAPRHRSVAVEDQRRVSAALANETLLPGAPFFALGPALSRMKPRAPAATEPTPVVLLEETRKGIPRRRIERLDRVLAHCTPVHQFVSGRAKHIASRPCKSCGPVSGIGKRRILTGMRSSGGLSSSRRTRSSSGTTSCCSTRSPFPRTCASARPPSS